MSGHQGEPQTTERIHIAHSAMPEHALVHGDTHMAYKQGHDEECYICTLLRQVTELRAALTAIRAKQPEMVATYRKYGIVFTDLGVDPTNWQHVAFSTYTQLCEIESMCAAALDDDE